MNNHRHYASIHNYSYIRRKIPLLSFDQVLMSVPPKESRGGNSKMWVHWSKVPLIYWLLMEPYNFDWVLWLDSDAVFKNMSTRIEDILKQYNIPFERNVANIPDLIFSGDTNVINTGVLLFRNSDWSRNMLKETYKMGQVVSNFEREGNHL